jgi:hypothetical protein
MPTFGNFDFVEVYQVVEDVSKQEMKSQLCFLALEEDILGSQMESALLPVLGGVVFSLLLELLLLVANCPFFHSKYWNACSET